MPLFRFIILGIAKTLSKVFGLATMAFFGRLPSRDDEKVAAVGLLSITWLPAFVAIFVPPLAEMLIPFLPDDDAILRAVAIAATLLIPVANGILINRMHNQREGRGRRPALIMVHAFWYTPLVGLVTTAIVILVPFIKASYLAKRYKIARLLVVIPKRSYEDVVDHIVEVLRARGIEAETSDPARSLRIGFGLLGFVLGHIFAREMATELRSIRGRDADDDVYEVLVHAADLTIVGQQKQSARVHAVLAEGIDERHVYFTWDDDAQALEDRMREQRERLAAGEEIDLDEIRQIVEDLATLELDKEEWSNVRRNLYRLERDAYARAAGASLEAPASRTAGAE